MAPHNRRRFLRSSLGLAGLGLLAGCGVLPPQASRPEKVRLIGVLGDAPSSRWDAFDEGLRELGWIEGQNLAVEYRWIEGNSERYRAFADELAQANIELVVAGTTTGALAAKQATQTVPIVAVLVSGEALENGIVKNIARPEGNVTGTAGISGTQLASKQLQLLKEAVPQASRVAVLTHRPGSSNQLRLQALQGAALNLQLQLQVFSIPNVAGLAQAVSAMGPAGVQALLILPSPVWDPIWKQIAGLAAQHRLPAISYSPEFPRAGGLLMYGVDQLDIHRYAATYVDRILKGARPGDLPMERPTRFDFLVNLRTAEALGLTIPQSVLAQATEVIQ